MPPEYHPGLRDRLRRRGRLPLLERMHALLQPEGLRLLDLGGGTGVTTVEFGRGSRELVVLEPSPPKVERGRKAHAPVTFVSGVAEEIPFEPGRFDRVVSLMSFHHFSDGAKACREAWRVLTPGGRFLIYDFSCGPPPARVLAFFERTFHHRSFRFLTAAELEGVVRGAGFREVRQESFRSGTIVMGQR